MSLHQRELKQELQSANGMPPVLGKRDLAPLNRAIDRFLRQRGLKQSISDRMTAETNQFKRRKKHVTTDSERSFGDGDDTAGI